ncbi:MAG: hypothetical protein EBQ95_01545 [Gammaproteobacteria bacterium]|nr:hypothetical protein [Gammaproteobacteria bacterium]
MRFKFYLLDVIVISSAFQHFLNENQLLEQLQNLLPEHMMWLEGIYLNYSESKYCLFMLKMAFHCIVAFRENYKELFSMIADFTQEQQIFMMTLFENQQISLQIYNQVVIEMIGSGLWGNYDIDEYYKNSHKKIRLLIQCAHILALNQLFDVNLFRHLSLEMNESILLDIHEIFIELSLNRCLNANILQGLFFPKNAQLTLQQMQCAAQIYIALHSKNLNSDYIIPSFKDFAMNTFHVAYECLLSLPKKVYEYPTFIISLMKLPYPEYFYENFNLLIALLDINPEFDICDFFTSNFENIDFITIGLEYLRIYEYLDELSFQWLITQKDPDLSAHLYVLLHKFYQISIDSFDKALAFESLEKLLIGIRILENNNLFQEYHLNLLIDSGSPEEFAEIIILCHQRRLDLQTIVNALEKKIITSSLLEDILIVAELLLENNQLTLENLLLILKTDNLEMAVHLFILANDFDMNDQLLNEFLAHSNPESRLKAHQYILHDATKTFEDWNHILDRSAHPLISLYFWDMLIKNELLEVGDEVYIESLALQFFKCLYQKYKEELDKELLSILITLPEMLPTTNMQFAAEGLLFLHQRRIYSWENLELLINHPFPDNILCFLKIQHPTNEDDYRNKVSLEHGNIFNDLNHHIIWKRFIGKQLQFSKIILLLNTPLSNKKQITQIQSTTHFLAYYIQEKKEWNTQLYNIMCRQMALDFKQWLNQNVATNKANQIHQIFKDLIHQKMPLLPESTLTIQEHLYYLLLLSTEMNVSIFLFFQQLYQCFNGILKNSVEGKLINYRDFEPLTIWLHKQYLPLDKTYHDTFYVYYYFQLAYTKVINSRVISEEGTFQYFELLRLLSTNQFEKIWDLIGSEVYKEYCKIHPQFDLDLYDALKTDFSKYAIDFDIKCHMDLICLAVFEAKCCTGNMAQSMHSLVMVKQEMLNHCMRVNKILPKKELEHRIDATFFQLIQVHPQFSSRRENGAEQEKPASYDLGFASGR